MRNTLLQYQRCSKCGTSRPPNILVNNACSDRFCDGVLYLFELAKRHTRWWLRRYPRLASFQDDMIQEASLAAWRAALDYDPGRGAALYTFAFARMRTAVRSFLAASGHGSRTLHERTLQLEEISPPSTEPDEAERPALLREAVEAAESPFVARCASAREARVLAFLATGSTLETAGHFAGVSRQRAHQIAVRWRALSE